MKPLNKLEKQMMLRTKQKKKKEVFRDRKIFHSCKILDKKLTSASSLSKE